MIVSANEKPLTKVDLIDSICRLGLQYHFESEIEQVLQQYHNNFVENGEITLEGNLHTLAPLFGLFRQEGFRVSPNVFNKFKDVHGNFNESLNVDIEGVLSLHEASHLRVHGEDILDEALVFTSTNLESIATQLSPSLAEQVKYSLRQPLHKGLPRLEARRYISIYQWDISCLDDLPEYMKICYRLLMKSYEETKEDTRKEGRAYSLHYVIIEFKKIAQAFMTEARWLKRKYIPTIEEYIKVSSVSCCYTLLATTSYIGMGDIATKDIFKWVINEAKIMKASTIVCRLMDDIVSNEVA
ncbi:hypothetical protein RIF29_31161 [Crotalaria pallida]|uniref:(+)-delta-cadinene synthase n=1 Tax=Crotalaria pallida TaxID=3830 RepID=A0AAN9EH80_CROPI